VFGLRPATRIYLAAGVTDMRKGFEGLYGLVRDRLSCEPLSGHLFLFCNGQRNRLDYFSAILPGLADFPIRCLVPDLTPALWVARHS
jgi:transposase